MAKQTICTHSPHARHGLCRACSDLAARGIHECPPTVPPEACEATEAAMREVPVSKKMAPRLHPSGIEPKVIKVETVEPAFNTADPKVSDFIAGAVVKNLLSYPAAVRQLKPDLPPVQQATLAYQLERDPYVQSAVQREMAKRGLDEKSKSEYISILWSMVADSRAGSTQARLTALRLLAKVFLPEGKPADSDKLQELPIANLSEGLIAMGLDKATLASVPEGAFAEKDFENEDESEGV